jgi:hypothetical protein
MVAGRLSAPCLELVLDLVELEELEGVLELGQTIGGRLEDPDLFLEFLSSVVFIYFPDLCHRVIPLAGNALAAVLEQFGGAQDVRDLSGFRPRLDEDFTLDLQTMRQGHRQHVARRVMISVVQPE